MNIYKKDIETYIQERLTDEECGGYNNLSIDIYSELAEFYDIKSDKENEKYVLLQIINNILSSKKHTREVIQQRKKQLNKLKKLKLPEQRSPEWYKMRKNKLTASSVASALNKCHFQSRNELILSKIEEQPFVTNPIIEWGVKYEEIAILFYEELFNVKVLDFGLIPHPSFPIFGASPDGICDDTGNDEYVSRMVEIKCPPKRKFTKTCPPHYFMQVQGQLEVCNLDECDFFQVKIEEYDDFHQYKEDQFIIDDHIVPGRTYLNYPKGVTVSYRKDKETTLTYFYPKLNLSNEEYEQWIEEKKNEILLHGDHFIESKWWKITRYECTLIERDKVWWINTIDEILLFHNDLLKYKNDPGQLKELKKEIENDKKKKKKIELVPQNEFQLISDDEE